jgi:hypothetical protein
VYVSLYFARKQKKRILYYDGQLFLLTDKSFGSSMDELSLMIQSIIDNELDDLILDLVYDIHSTMKGIPEDQLEINNNNNNNYNHHGGNKTSNKQFLIPFSQFQTTAIEKQTCICPHCGQTNIIAIRFAYHLAKCLGERKNKYFHQVFFVIIMEKYFSRISSGVGRRSSRQAKHRIVDQVMTITAVSDDSRSNGDEFPNNETINSIIPEDAGSCTDSTSSSSNNHRRIVIDDQEYTEDFDNDDEDEDDWKPKKKKRKNLTINLNKKKKKKEEIIDLSQPINELDFDNCIIPLDKLW